MLRCPNASRPGHPPPDAGRFSASALVIVGPEWDVREVRDFLGPEAVCCDCMAEAEDVEE